jgi:hypothetical protein
MEPGGEIPARPDSPNPAQPGAALGGAHQGRAGDGSPAGVLGRGGVGPAGALRSTGPARGWREPTPRLERRPGRGRGAVGPYRCGCGRGRMAAQPGKRREAGARGRRPSRHAGGPAGIGAPARPDILAYLAFIPAQPWLLRPGGVCSGLGLDNPAQAAVYLFFNIPATHNLIYNVY